MNAKDKEPLVNAEIISIGTELLLGEIVDGNAAFLASELAQLGINLFWVSQVGDNRARIEETLRRAIDRSNLVITTGGLGPTDDDVTRESIAAVLDQSPSVDAKLERTLRARFRVMNRPMPEKNLKQAWLIPGAESMANPLGTAPGWWVSAPRDRLIASMPGPPSEMRGMWTDQVRPRLERLARGAFLAVTLKTFGAGESAIEERLGDLVRSANPSVATYAKRDGVYVRVAAKGRNRKEAEGMLEPVVDQVRQALGSEVFGTGDDSLASVVGVLLQAQRCTVATAESITGGLIVSYLTDVPGSSSHVLGGLVAYNQEIKARFGVPESGMHQKGVVSEATAFALAEVARNQFGATFGIGSTGAAGPEDHGGKPAGVAYVGVCGPEQRRAREVKRTGPRDMVKHFVALSALDLLRRVLTDSRGF